MKKEKKTKKKFEKNKITEIVNSEFGIFHPGTVVINEIIDKKYNNSNEVNIDEILSILERPSLLREYLDEYFHISDENEEKEYFQMVNEVADYLKKINE